MSDSAPPPASPSSLPSPASSARRAELVSRLAAVRGRLAAAAATAGRDPRGIVLVAVTKTYPAADAAALVELGCTDLGESRDQEAAAKTELTAVLLRQNPNAPSAPRWHFIGRLQSRKCRSVARYASAVHSVDRLELVPLLAAGVERAERPPLEVFVQVSLDDNPERGGARPADVGPLAEAVAGSDQLRLRGVMAIAPLGADPVAAFARLAEVSATLRQSHPEASAISAGMSEDLEAAVAAGSTHVRVGSALLGRRSPVFG